MEFTLMDAEIDSSEVDYINAWHFDTAGDPAETQAIKHLFEGILQNPVSSTKSMTGHLRLQRN